ncbi:hypothetical protein BGW80DRAFT_1256219 [Lactifluus volemus]|nr:hypothetical protein BGW80DRAFT_1256219 [Lactifluus volemus]
MSSTTPDPTASAYYSVYNSAVYFNLFVGIAWGGQPASLLLLGPHICSTSHPRIFMLGMTTLMFVLSLIALVLETAFYFPASALSHLPTGNRWRDMYILSDIICAWRAVVLWNKDKRVIAILMLLILGNIAAAGYDLVVNLTPFFNPSIHKDNPRRTMLIMLGNTLGTNLLCTGLIGWKAWEHRVTIKQHLGECNVSTRVEKILAILIESGSFTAVSRGFHQTTQIVYLIAGLGVFPEPFSSATQFALLVLLGAYPTSITILVSAQKSPIDYYSTHASGLRFANNRPLPGSHNQAVVWHLDKDEEKSV